MIDKSLSYIGLAKKAGKVSVGAFLTERAVKSKHAKFVIITMDASDRTRKDIEGLCIQKGVEIERYFTKSELGALFSKESVSVIGILDDNFRNIIKDSMDDSRGKGKENICQE